MTRHTSGNVTISIATLLMYNSISKKGNDTYLTVENLDIML